MLTVQSGEQLLELQVFGIPFNLCILCPHRTWVSEKYGCARVSQIWSSTCGVYLTLRTSWTSLLLTQRFGFSALFSWFSWYLYAGEVHKVEQSNRWTRDDGSLGWPFNPMEQVVAQKKTLRIFSARKTEECWVSFLLFVSYMVEFSMTIWRYNLYFVIVLEIHCQGHPFRFPLDSLKVLGEEPPWRLGCQTKLSKIVDSTSFLTT